MSERATTELAARLGYTFADPGLLVEAMTHRSWCAENPGAPSNERLEFLGDAVLGLVIADYLFQVEGAMPEGELAMARAAVVSTEALAQVATRIELGQFLRLGKGEAATGGRAKRSILADAMEAVIGAVYVDGGLDAARRLVLPLVADRLAGAVAGPGEADHKTRLQEASARQYGQVPRYEVSGTGPGPRPALHRRRAHRRAPNGATAPASRRRRPNRPPPAKPGGPSGRTREPNR